MPGPRKDRRKKNYSPAEREVIVAAMERFDARLHGAESGNTSKVKKDEILRKVTAQVNALGHEVRTPQDIIKKMNDLRGVVRNKMATIAKHARGTGGGPPCPIRLSEEEEIIARCLRREQVEGLEGHDSSEPPMRTGVQEGAGPSTAGSVRPTPSPQQPASVADPLGSQQALLEGSGQSSAQEVVEEEIAHEEMVGNEQEVVQSEQEVAQTACQEALLTRIAVALEGRQPAREAPGDAPLPPNEAPPRQVRARNLGTRRSPRRGQ